MDLKLIQKLVRLMTRADVTELEIDDAPSGLKVRLRRGPEPQAGPIVQVLGGGAGGAQLAYGSPAAAAPAGGGAGEASEGDALPEGAQQVPSPMVGTFYRAPSPESESFVEVGARVKADDVICIIEAMKVMNEIKAGVSGEVLAILVENGEPVEYGQPLFLVKTA